MRCVFCNCDNPDYAVVCEMCGEFLPKSDVLSVGTEPILDPRGEKRIRCSYCWHSNAGEATTCEVCGMPLKYVPYPEAEGDYSKVVKREDLVPKVAPNETPTAEPVPEGMVRCPSCRTDNPRYAIFCDVCGKRLASEDEEGFKEFQSVLKTVHQECITEVPEFKEPVAPPVPDDMVRCPRCRSDVPKTSYACNNCGKRLKGDEADDKLFENFASVVIEANEKAERESEERAEARQKPKKCVCGTANPPGAMFCRNCGELLQGGCGCGYQNTADAVYCRNCGKVLRKKCACGAVNYLYATYCKSCGVLLKKRCTCDCVNPPFAKFCRSCGGRLLKRCDCGAENVKRAVFCRVCGKELRKICDCGFENAPFAKFCKKCGGYIKKEGSM